MQSSECLERFQRLPYRAQGSASFLSCWRWYRRWVDGRIFLSQAVDIAASGLAFATLFPLSREALGDVTCLPSFYRATLGPLCRREGYCFELVEKWNGVYSPPYFRGRIREQLGLGRPVLCLMVAPAPVWTIVVGYRAQQDCLVVLTGEGRSAEIDDWYSKTRALVLVAEETSRGAGEGLVSLMRRALSQRNQAVYTGYAVGDRAYEEWRQRASAADTWSKQACQSMRDRLLESRKGANELIGLLLAQYPAAQAPLRPAFRELQRLIGELEALDGQSPQVVDRIASIDRDLFRLLEPLQ